MIKIISVEYILQQDDSMISFLENSDALWINKDYEEFISDDISDDYYKHILYFVSEGKGWRAFLSQNRINNLFAEAYRREICRPDVLLILHSLALYYHGYTTYKSRYKVSWDGQYIKNY